jgi:hypothetical protein
MPDAFSSPQEPDGEICNLNINGSNPSYGKKKKQNTAFHHDLLGSAPKHSQLRKYMNLH